jgi:hypothetical protein
MPILSAAVAVVGALCLLDLLLMFGVIRRLREHSGMLSRISGLGDPMPPVTGLAGGDSPAAFSATTTTGALVTETSPLRIAAFFSSSCPACAERVPAFADKVTSYGISRDAMLAVVQHDSGPLPAFLDQLAEVCQVHIESNGGPVGEAFKVRAYPAFCVFNGHGVLLASSEDASVLSVAASTTPAAQPAGAR